MARMSGNRYFAEAMRGYGVSHIFYVNSVVGAAMQEMDRVGVKRVVTHGEKAAAYMADGYARASRRPGICLSQDIGSTNLLAGMRDPYMAGAPVIAITGGQGDMPRSTLPSKRCRRRRSRSSSPAAARFPPARVPSW